MLICGLDGFEDYFAWAVAHASDAEAISQNIRAVSACLSSRVNVQRQTFPLHALGLVDGRVSVVEKLQLAEKLLALPRCCRGEFLDCFLQARCWAVESTVAIMSTQRTIAGSGFRNLAPIWATTMWRLWQAAVGTC